MHDRLTLTAWSLRRSGPAMTLKGTIPGGVEAKVPNVKIVEVQDGRVVATDVGNQRFDLLTGTEPDLVAIVREMIFGEGTDASLQRVIDLCNEARVRHGIERA